MAHPLFIGQDAQDDIVEAWLYYESQKTGLGDVFTEELEVLLKQISQLPLSFPNVFGTKRRAILRRFKFNVFFTFNNKEVQVLAVMHGSRDPKRWQVR